MFLNTVNKSSCVTPVPVFLQSHVHIILCGSLSSALFISSCMLIYSSFNDCMVNMSILSFPSYPTGARTQMKEIFKSHNVTSSTWEMLYTISCLHNNFPDYMLESADKLSEANMTEVFFNLFFLV